MEHLLVRLFLATALTNLPFVRDSNARLKLGTKSGKRVVFSIDTKWLWNQTFGRRAWGTLLLMETRKVR
uniref:Putative secreted protein n=1 Tax=Ixodes ricinus TaxID=34613 RepID=A0A147BLN1_IXORI